MRGEVERIRFSDFDPDAHMGLLSSWLALPDIAEWWPDTAHQQDEARSRRAGTEHRLILLDGRPVGYTRWERVDVSAASSLGLHDVPEGTVLLNILLGERRLLGSGLGSTAIRLLCETLFADPSIPFIGTVTSTENPRAIRAFKKAGLRVLQEYEDPRYGRCVILVRGRPEDAGRTRSRNVPGMVTAAARDTAELRIEQVGSEPSDLLFDMMASYNALESIPWTRDRGEPAVIKLLASPDLGIVRYIVEGAEVRGYFVLTWGFDLEWNGRDAFLTELYLQPQARKRGLGRRVLSRIEELAKEHGARALHLMVLPDNEPAVRLYRGAGYASPPRIFLTKALS